MSAADGDEGPFSELKTYAMAFDLASLLVFLSTGTQAVRKKVEDDEPKGTPRQIVELNP